MKFRATKKEMRNGYSKIITIGYCDAQHLLQYQSPIAYSAGTYGWDCDYYEVGDTLISTGYRPISSGSVIRDYDTVSEYDKRAAAIVYNRTNHTDAAVEVNKLLEEFVKKLTNKK